MDASGLIELSDLAQHAYFWVGAIIGAVALGRHIWKRQSMPSTSLQYVNESCGSVDKTNAAVARSLSCVIVDDMPNDFPVDFMRGFFSEISVETKVSLNDAERLSKYDVIFLDVAGVVLEDMQRGGAILIERIRRAYSDGIVISVSSKKYDVEVTQYFANADIRIRKPIQAQVIEEQMLAHLRSKAGPHALAAFIDSAAVRTIGERGLRKIVRSLVRDVATTGADQPPSLVLKAGVDREYRQLVAAIRRLK